ncbi:MAG: WbqC family protein [Bacteroidales bacterium]|nr:WbqC family protein [Bacteroidales bacterium]
MSKKVILSTAYLAPVQYYTKLLKYDEVFIETHENFIKQSYRNRCKIYGANGDLSLSIPVKKISVKTKIINLLIDYDTNWQKLHWKSIESSYRSSPFFEFYEDDLKPFYEKKYKFLIDFNSEIQNVILEHLDIKINLKFTDKFRHKLTEEFDDFREQIHPKMETNDPDFITVEYTQVFHEKHGFIPNLSIIDLLFNEGPNAIEALK